MSPETQMAIRAILERMEGKRLFISIRELKRNRSSNQNAFYWGAVIPVVSQMFYNAGTFVSDDTVHEYLKKRFIPAETMIDLDGKLFEVPASTSNKSTMEFENYLETVRAWAAEYNTVVPYPHETQFNYTLKGSK